MGKIYKKTRYIKQDTVVVDTDKRHSVIDKYYEEGFHCVHCGPKEIRFGVYSETRHKLIFIKKVKQLNDLERQG